MSYKSDLKEAKEVEQEVSDYLCNHFYEKLGDLIHVDNFKGDLYSTIKNMYIEIKRDRLAEKTANFFLEENCYNYTESFVWIFVDDHHYFITTKPKLTKLIESGKYKKVKGGDNKKYAGWLIPRNDMRGICRVELREYNRGL